MISIENLQGLIQEAIVNLNLPKSPAGLYEPITYTLQGGGKRLRPLLTLAACQAVGVSPEEALSQALGIEMFHNFTLLHDDVMDRADTRRGRPTVHCKWNVATAILSGDAMLTLASQLMSRCPQEKLGRVTELFNSTAMEIYEGQQFDMDFEQRSDVTIAEYMEMIRLKTAVLLGCALSVGAIMGHASEQTERALYEFGVNLGLAFQLRDDYLDTFGSEEEFGKKPGGDILNDKKTWLLITAQSLAPEEVNAIISMPRSAEKVAAMTNVYRQLHLPAQINALIEEYAVAALDSLSRAGLSPADTQWFEQLTAGMTSRTR